MPDPITLGALIAMALASGATEAGKVALGAAAKDAYAALKTAASRLLGSPVDQLEERPDSVHRQGMVAELVDELPEPDRHSLGQLAEALSKALAAEGLGGQRIAQTVNQFNNTGSGQQYNAPNGTQNFGTDTLPKPR